ncbi:histidine phosphatase family protein [Adhaeribacter terreus]|uniref:Histidine phosphatase family protein n=1 Tax=Adhaeribacter terreus TaxID=529703 RepID=A0ABW0EE49_9BACT
MNSPEGLRHIFLVRHYEPDVERSGFFNCEEASRFISDYDAANLVKTAFTRPAGLPEKLPKVYCSALPRAKQTARLLYGETTELVENADFNEFQRKIFQLPLFKFPIEVWLAAARFSWMLGLNSRGIESFRKARQRAMCCAETLARYAETEEEVVLVAHGFLNAFIRQALKKLGWRIVRHDGNSYLGVTQLVKPHSLQVPENIAAIMAEKSVKR